MPCYEPWALDAYERSEWDRFYRNVTKGMLERWLCDALRGNPPHPHCVKWWNIHQEKEGK